MKPRSAATALRIPAIQNNLTLLQKDEAGFLRLSQMLKTMAGINLPLSEKNLSLMAGRLNAVLQRRNIDAYKDYATLLESGEQEAIQEFICCLTTNTTEFFREAAHFQVLTDVLGPLFSAKREPRELRVWCAASSTGQEPYTLLMTILEKLGESLRGTPGTSVETSLKMLATDIDTDVLERAAEGQYTEEDLRNVPAPLRSRYFDNGVGPRSLQVKPQYRRLIRFAQLNLIQPSYPFKHKFDIIFCRNVLIYFDRPTTQGILDRMTSALAPGGYLFVGHAEGGMMRSDQLERISHAVYRRKAD